MKALVVDDARIMRRILGQTLREMQFEVLEADNGQVALEAVRMSGGVDVIFLDWNMPVMTGLEFLKALRQDEDYGQIPVCMVTSEAEQSSIMEALTAGANEYLMKPFTPEMLREKVQIVMGAV